MKINKVILTILLSTLTLNSCNDNFLDEPKPQDIVKEDIVYSNATSAQTAMSGILRASRGQFTRTDAANIGSMLYARSLKGNDVITAPTWFKYDYAYENREPSYTRTIFTWEFPYYLIRKLNAFIEGVSGSSSITDEDKNYLLGQAYAYRGFLYFQLSLEFQNTYGYDENADAPPIYTSSEQTMEPMSTMKEIYDLIVSDLVKATNLCAEKGLDKSYWNKHSASAVLAQVYQVMGDWDKAEQAAIFAYGGNPNTALDAESYRNGFNDFENSPEWLWCTPQQEDQSAYYSTAPFAFADFYTDSYQGTYYNEEFVSKFSDTDVRNLFVKIGDNGWAQYISKKFVFTFASDVPVIRTPEMILIEAEAKFRRGKELEANDLLYTLQKNRDPNAIKSKSTGNALLEEILLERRKELYCEIGVEWFDAKRLQKGLKRTGNHRVYVDLKPNDKRFYLKIPQPEIDANDYINSSINNNR